MIAAIFDMDGTLINSANAICEAVNEIRQSRILEPLPHAFITQTINTPGKDWAKILYNIENFSHSSFKEGFERYFIKHYEQSVLLYEGVLGVLQWLKSRGAYLAIATNAPQASLGAVLAKHGILPFFDKVLGVSAGIEPKPHPMMLNLIKDEANAVLAQKFGAQNLAKNSAKAREFAQDFGAKNCIFVGDSLKDKEAAKNAKMPFLWAKWGENSHENSAENLSESGEKFSKNSQNPSENVFEFTNANELKNLLEKFM